MSMNCHNHHKFGTWPILCCTGLEVRNKVVVLNLVFKFYETSHKQCDKKSDSISFLAFVLPGIVSNVNKLSTEYVGEVTVVKSKERGLGYPFW